ncbi:MAG: hypothetical protein HYR98_04840 [Nitrospirae bacterium]|nr:hypothetical protein [Nitrospirota bacterium]MBI3394199.1 hypothetical protein [Nitrospirota bacterium]
MKRSAAGTLLFVLLLVLAPAAGAVEMDVHAGIYSINKFLDYAMDEHPSVNGPIFGAAILLGEKDAVTKHRFSLDFVSADGQGNWRKGSDSGDGKVDIGLTTLTYAALFNIGPSWPVNPYIGIGAGVAYVTADASSTGTKTDSVSAKVWIPAVVVPVGIRAKLGDRVTLAVEGGFLDGLYVTGNLRFAF